MSTAAARPEDSTTDLNLDDPTAGDAPRLNEDPGATDVATHASDDTSDGESDGLSDGEGSGDDTHTPHTNKPTRRRHATRRTLTPTALTAAILAALLTLTGTTLTITPLRHAITTTATTITHAITHPIATLTGHHPNNPDTPATDPNTQHALNYATHTRNTITHLIAPTKGTNATLITPTGTNWWNLATSTAPSLKLFNLPTPPNTATWYATTAGKSYTTTTHNLLQYQALHIAFTTPQAAQKYELQTLPTTTSQDRTVLLRGNIVTFAPAWLNPQAEPYKHDNQALNNTAHLHPTAASWHINLGDQTTQLANESPYPNVIHQAALDLGITPQTQWTGTSTTPQGPWTGTLTNYNPHTISALNLPKTLAQPDKSTCTTNTCNEVAAPLAQMADSMYINDGHYTYGFDKTYEPTNPPTNALLTGGLDYPAIEGTINASHNYPLPPVGVIKFVITDPTHMTLYTPTGPPTARTGN